VDLQLLVEQQWLLLLDLLHPVLLVDRSPHQVLLQLSLLQLDAKLPSPAGPACTVQYSMTRADIQALQRGQQTATVGAEIKHRHVHNLDNSNIWI
jgi:hypothetical protein